VPNADKYLPEVLEQDNLSEKAKILYLIGPEGDFTKAEIATAIKWGIQPVRLPVNSILRVETAAITMLAMMFYHFGKVISK
jgi:RsmE family RNA methyltransferase